MEAEIIDLRQLHADHATVEALRANELPADGDVVDEGLWAWQWLCRLAI